MSLQMRFIRYAGLAALAIPAIAAIPASPGTVNFIEGQVSVDGREATSNSIGSSGLREGSVLRTGRGKAEVLLTPGVFLRVGNNSEIRMLSAGLMDTRIAVQRGTAMVEATDVRKENNIQLATAGLHAAIKDEGIYRIDADTDSVAVFKGKVEIREGDEKVEAKKGKTVTASGEEAPLTVQKFDVDEAKKTDDLYQWSNQRSKYLADATAATAQRVILQPSLWSGPGWYWNPWMSTYSWLPRGDAFYSPFGYGFYSPRYYTRPIYVVPRYRSYPRMRGPVMRGPMMRGPSMQGSMRSGGHRRGR
jgi:hypothetical protein